MENFDHIVKLCETVARCATEKTLVSVGAIPVIITYAECRKIYGSAVSRELRAAASIQWHIHGKGSKTSGVYAMRADVVDYFQKKSLNRIIQDEVLKIERNKNRVRS